MLKPSKNFLSNKSFWLLVGISGILFYMFVSLGSVKWGRFLLENNEYVTVVGTSSSAKDNKIATFTATVTSKNVDKAEALKMANDNMGNVITKAKELGVLEKDIKTSTVNIYQLQDPYFEDGVTKYKSGDWQASLSVDLKLRDATKAEEFTQQLSMLKIDNLWGPNFTVDTADNNDQALLANAIEDAHKKAAIMASATGRKLGKAIRVIEGYASNDVMMFDRAMGMGGGGGGVVPGTSEVSKTVTVTYTLE